MSLEHQNKIKKLQLKIEQQGKQQAPLAFNFGKSSSNTTRSKCYKKGCLPLSCESLNQVIHLDVSNQRILVEPCITMEELVKATLPHGLMPPIVPEFKGITVGGAIMGAAAESSSHRRGIFHDSCTELHILNGKGELSLATPDIHHDLFYGLSGSYGSLGLLVAAELALIPAKKNVKLSCHHFENPQQAIHFLNDKLDSCEFIDGVIFSSKHAVIILGELTDCLTTFSSQSTWFACQLLEDQTELIMPLFDYLFRYDQGAFWMGAFLFSFPFLMRYLGQGLLGIWPSQGWFSEKEIAQFKTLSFPGTLATRITKPWMKSQILMGLLHKAEKWVQDRLIIQDFCIPFSNASAFLKEILHDPATFPIWLCPIKGTHLPQFLAPHYGHSQLLNFGIYGSPSYSAPMSTIMKKLEEKTFTYGGRKVLYSRSYYEPHRFWQIYSKNQYEELREKTYAKGIWRELIDKVLSE